MFFYEYSALSKEDISSKLGQHPAPRTTSPAADLGGKAMKIVLDNGPSLDYEFECKSNLTLSEGGEPAVECPYAALVIRDTILVSHMIPGTMRGYNLIIDVKTRLATVFEVWFCGYRDNREVQREIYFGYVDCCSGEGDPQKRHTFTNRVEGKGFYWKDDTGTEILNFYPSVIYSTFVELSDPRGGITISAPSDYVKLSDILYAYSRVECEYSGTFVLEVVDLFSVKNVGVRLGFDEHDELDYRMYTAEGEITGTIASFESMTDYGTKVPEVMSSHGETVKSKGARPVYRPRHLYPSMTADEVKKKLSEEIKPFSGESIMPGANKMELSDYLVGKQFTLRYDNGGPVWEYAVDSIDLLRWRKEGESEWHTEKYEAFEPADKLILFCHLHSCSDNARCPTIAIDFSNGLTTCIDARIGSYRSDWEVGHRAIFGVVEAEGINAPLVRRHEITKDLVGKAYTWTYSDMMSSIHVYSSPESYSWTIFLPNGSGGMMWSSPCIYVKLREDAYMMSWVEETCNGSQGTFVFNPRIMHDAGYFFGISPERLNLTSFGACARNAGCYDIAKYFEIKQRG